MRNQNTYTSSSFLKAKRETAFGMICVIHTLKNKASMDHAFLQLIAYTTIGIKVPVPQKEGFQ